MTGINKLFSRACYRRPFYFGMCELPSLNISCLLITVMVQVQHWAWYVCLYNTFFSKWPLT